MIKDNGFCRVATVLGVSPWGKFTLALNAAVQYAMNEGIDYIIFQVSSQNFILRKVLRNV